jgi:DNA-binding NarL/FixJ family response regulator
MTTSTADQDIQRAYNLNANCYITKPVEFEHFVRVVRSIEDFWLTTATLPRA